MSKKNIIDSSSKIDNFINNIFKRFKKKYSKKGIKFNSNDILRKFHEQNGKCHITGHYMTHLVDSKKRIDNIWNIAIFVDNSQHYFDYNSFNLVINLIYSVKKIYNLDNDGLLNTYSQLSNTI